MFDSSSYVNPTPLAHADISRDVLPRGGTSQSCPVFELAVYYFNYPTNRCQQTFLLASSVDNFACLSRNACMFGTRSISFKTSKQSDRFADKRFCFLSHQHARGTKTNVNGSLKALLL
ncbi:hypothetical protein TNCV_1606111 [Trichonephila clavipes]|nr:hypothetical protein TNCV_1606111 [Trichonephila clavipes]